MAGQFWATSSVARPAANPGTAKQRSEIILSRLSTAAAAARSRCAVHQRLRGANLQPGLALRGGASRVGIRSLSSTRAMPLVADEDRFGGMVVTMESVAAEPSPAAFAASLAASLDEWRAAGKRGIWIAVPKSRTELLPACVDAGFDLHHTEPDRIVMNSWIHDSENMLPGYTTHTMGVGAVVINAQREILALQEATGPASERFGGAKSFWKYPTGLVDGGEDAGTAAVREVYEETGVDTEVVSLVALREAHGASAGGGGAAGLATNLFAVFLLKPKEGGNVAIKIDEREVAGCCWMDCDEYLEQSMSRMPKGGVYYTLNELAIACYDGNYSGLGKGEDLPLGAQVGQGSNTVYYSEPPPESAVAAAVADSGSSRQRL